MFTNILWLSHVEPLAAHCARHPVVVVVKRFPSHRNTIARFVVGHVANRFPILDTFFSCFNVLSSLPCSRIIPIYAWRIRPVFGAATSKASVAVKTGSVICYFLEAREYKPVPRIASAMALHWAHVLDERNAIPGTKRYSKRR